MISTFLEAVRATTQPCTFLLLAPTLVTITVVRAGWSALVGALVAAIVGGWLLATSSVVLDGTALQVSAVVAAGVWTLAAAAPSQRRLAWAGTATARTTIAVGGTFVATLWWRPCVGSELGRLLTAAQVDPAPAFVGLAVYMIGAMMPVVVVVLAACAVAAPERAATAVAIAGCVLAGTLAIGRHDSVVVALTRWTQG